MRALVLVVALSGCVRYIGGARPVSPEVVNGEGWVRVPITEVVRQRSISDCGVAAAAMVAWRWLGAEAAAAIQRRPAPPYPGLRAVQVRDLLVARGLTAWVIAGGFSDLEHEIGLGRPVIVGTVKPRNDGYANRHYEVVVALHPGQQRIITLDPKTGWRQWTYKAFAAEWKAAQWTTIVSLGGSLHPPKTADFSVGSQPKSPNAFGEFDRYRIEIRDP